MNLFEEVWGETLQHGVGVHQNSNYPSGSNPFFFFFFRKIDFDNSSPGGNHLVHPKWPSKYKYQGIYVTFKSVSPVNGSSLDYLGRKQMALIIIIMGFELIKRRPCSRKHFLCTFIGNLPPPPCPSYQSPLLLAIGWLYSTEKTPKSQILSRSSGYSAYRIPRIIFFF